MNDEKETRFKEKLETEKDISYLKALLYMAKGWSKDWVVNAIKRRIGDLTTHSPSEER